jgi:RecA-family ATPase
VKRAADITPQLPSWVWNGRIPRGGITLIVGDGGVGKSTLSVELAARLSRGELSGEPESSMLALQEDDEAAVTVPRLLAAGADLARIDLDGDPGWRFPRDLDRLDAYAGDKRPALVVMDPLDASVPGLASQAARQILDDLAAVARRHNMALVALHHLTKSGNSIDQRIGGGRAVRAVARSVLVLERLDPIAHILLELPPDADLLCLHHHKSNYGPEAAALLFERTADPHPVDGGSTVARLLEREEQLDVPAEVLSSDSRDRGWRYRVARTAIERFLLRGPMAADDLQADVTALEITQRTFERARSDLANEGVIERYQEKSRHWWRLRIGEPSELL